MAGDWPNSPTGLATEVVRNGPDRRSSPLVRRTISTEADTTTTNPTKEKHMSTTIDINQAELEEFQDRVFADLAAGYGGVMTSIGSKLGLYAALAGAGPLTSAEVAERTGCAERYVREWLNSQVAADYVDYDREHKTYELPPERAAVLADPESPAHLTPAFDVVASMWLDEHLAIERSEPARVSPGGHTTSGSPTASPRSSAPVIGRCSFRTGWWRWTAWSPGWRLALPLPTSVAAMAIPPC